MSLEDSSFKLYTNDTLTTEQGSVLSIINKTDLSDNPQDFVRYFGSLIAANQIRVDSDFGTPGTDLIYLTPTDITPVFIVSHAYVVGDIVQPIIANGMRYKCTTAGTSASSSPTWPTSGVGSTVSTGSAVFTFLGAKHEPEEVILALVEADLDTNTPGAALSLGDTVLGGTANAITIYMRVVNAVNIVSTARDIGIFINEFQEEVTP